MGRFTKSTMNKVLGALLAVILVGGVAHAVYIDAFNKTLHTAAGADKTQQTYLEFNDRDDSTSTWVKRNYNLYGKTVDINAQTVDGTLFNNSDDTVESWEMRIDIESDCFINNAWTGTVEIHQFVGTDEEAVQTLDLRNYDVADVELANLYDGDLLIPLAKGDHLVYHPAAKDELSVAPHSELTMGMIFYYLDDLNLSSYSVDYRYHRDFTYGFSFIALAALAILWVLLFAGTKVADASYKRAMRDMELRKSGLASMSSIYSIISFIDLANDTIISVHADAKTKGKPPEGAGARDKLIDVFERDTAEPYRDIVLEFIDLDTLPARLERESIACEYESMAYGWSCVRFFAVDREAGEPLDRVLFTIQDINDEKRQLGRFEARAKHAERENRARNAFVMGVLSSMQLPIWDILELDEKILDESGEEAIREYAKRIGKRARLLSYMAKSGADSSRLAAGKTELAPDEYSFDDLASDIRDIAESMLEEKMLTLETDIPKTFPDRLVGNALGIERALIGIFSYAIRQTETGSVKFSIFGKEHEGVVHLLYSVHINGSGIDDEEVRDLAAFIADLERGGDYIVQDSVKELEMAAVQLAYVGSKLQVISSLGEECEFYFEIEQRVAASPAKADEHERAK